MQRKRPYPTAPLPSANNTERQKEFVARRKAQGYVLLSGVYVPAALRPRIRALVKAYVKKWEAENTTF